MEIPINFNDYLTAPQLPSEHSLLKCVFSSSWIIIENSYCSFIAEAPFTNID